MLYVRVYNRVVVLAEMAIRRDRFRRTQRGLGILLPRFRRTAADGCGLPLGKLPARRKGLGPRPQGSAKSRQRLFEGGVEPETS
jgi:hypothetical protein